MKLFYKTISYLFSGIILFILIFIPINSYKKNAQILSNENSNYTTQEIRLPILMYHNIISDTEKPNMYEIKISDLENDFNYIKSSGYNTVNFEDLFAYVYQNKPLPSKPIMITFDDGYYSNLTYLPTMLQNFDFKAVISVVGNFTQFNKNTSATKRYIYFDYEDMQRAIETERIEIQNHSDKMHYIKNGRKGVCIKNGENIDSYKKIFADDISSMHNKLKENNINAQAFAYPYGSYCKESEEVLKTLGYKASLTCNERINIITKDANCLFLLGRVNRSGIGINAEKILKKLDKVT